MIGAWLRNQRGLAPGLIALCHETGIVHADHKRNAVFVYRNHNGLVTGAERVGTGIRPWRGMAAGSRKAQGSFRITYRIRLTATRGVPAVYLSTNGATANLPDWIRAWNPKRVNGGNADDVNP